jgi:hypothetical protein
MFGWAWVGFGFGLVFLLLCLLSFGCFFCHVLFCGERVLLYLQKIMRQARHTGGRPACLGT